MTDDQVHRAVDLVELAKRQISQLSVFVAWRDELPWGGRPRSRPSSPRLTGRKPRPALADTWARPGPRRRSSPSAARCGPSCPASNVEIAKPEQTVRDVTNLQNVTFEWLVKPTRPGRTTLTLRVFNQVITPDGPIELERPALVHEMSVKIGVLDWLTWHMERMKGLQWLIGGVLAALGLRVRQPGQAAPLVATAIRPLPPVAPPPAASPPGSPRP